MNGHDSDCICLSCNPSEPGQNAFQQLCGGCARPVREVEEGVWVLHGSDECEAGGVHAPPRPPVSTEDVWVIRSRVGGSWWNAQLGWRGNISSASLYEEGDLPRVRMPIDGEWIRLSQVPF